MSQGHRGLGRRLRLRDGLGMGLLIEVLAQLFGPIGSLLHRAFEGRRRQVDAVEVFENPGRFGFEHLAGQHSEVFL